MTARPQLTRDEAKHVLAEIAGLVNADRAMGGRIWTGQVIRGAVTPICHWQAAEDPDWCREMFEDYCRELSVLGSASATHDEMDAAEQASERLVRLLLGESECGAAEYRYVGEHGPAA